MNFLIIFLFLLLGYCNATNYEVKVHTNKVLLPKRNNLEMRDVAEPIKIGGTGSPKPVENVTQPALGPETRENHAHHTTISKPTSEQFAVGSDAQKKTRTIFKTERRPEKLLLTKRNNLVMKEVADPINVGGKNFSKPFESSNQPALGPDDQNGTRKNLANLASTTSKPELVTEIAIPEEVVTSALDPEYSEKLEQILREIEAQERLILESQTTLVPVTRTPTEAEKIRSTLKPTEEVTEASTTSARKKVRIQESTTVRSIEIVQKTTSQPEKTIKEIEGQSTTDENNSTPPLTTLEPVTQSTSKPEARKETSAKETSSEPSTTSKPEPATSTANPVIQPSSAKPKQIVNRPKPRRVNAYHLTALEKRLELAIAKLEQTSRGFNRTLKNLQIRSKNPSFANSKNFGKLISRAGRYAKVYPAWVLRDPEGGTTMFIEENLGMLANEVEQETDTEHF